MAQFEDKYNLIWKKFHLKQDNEEDDVEISVGICGFTNKVCLLPQSETEQLFYNKVRFKNNTLCELHRVCLNCDCEYSFVEEMFDGIQRQILNIPYPLFSKGDMGRIINYSDYKGCFDKIIQSIKTINDSLKREEED